MVTAEGKQNMALPQLGHLLSRTQTTDDCCVPDKPVPPMLRARDVFMIEGESNESCAKSAFFRMRKEREEIV